MRAWAVRTWADGFEILTEMMAAKNKNLQKSTEDVAVYDVSIYHTSVFKFGRYSNTSFEYIIRIRSIIAKYSYLEHDEQLYIQPLTLEVCQLSNGSTDFNDIRSFSSSIIRS